MPGAKSNCQAVQLGHWLVVLSGNNTVGHRCRRVFAFNTLWREWTEWQATPYTDCAAASTEHHLYVAGGCHPVFNGGKAFGDVYKLNDSHDAWNVISTLPRPCCECAATILNGKFYVAGTVDESRSSSYVMFAPKPQPSAATSVQVLDLQTNAWSEITMLTTKPRRFFSSMSMTRLVTLAHLLITDRLTTYDVVTKKSGDLPPLPGTDDSASHAGMAVVNDRLLVWKTMTKNVYVLSEDHIQWSPLPDLCKERNYGSLCTVDNLVYAVGGGIMKSAAGSSLECFK